MIDEKRLNFKNSLILYSRKGLKMLSESSFSPIKNFIKENLPLLKIFGWGVVNVLTLLYGDRFLNLTEPSFALIVGGSLTILNLGLIFFYFKKTIR